MGMLKLINVNIKDTKYMDLAKLQKYYKELLEARIRFLDAKINSLFNRKYEYLITDVYKSDEAIDDEISKIEQEFEYLKSEYKSANSYDENDDLLLKIHDLELKVFSNNQSEEEAKEYVDYSKNEWFKKKTKFDYKCEREFERVFESLVSEKMRNRYK